MRIRNTTIATTVLIASLALVPAAGASADTATTGGGADAESASIATVGVGGGAWDYGVANGQVYSNYHHATKYHTASACVKSMGGENCVRATAAAGSWAKAKRGSSFLGNTAYWSVI